MIIDNNLIAYEYFKDQYGLNPIYPSGQKTEDNLIDKYASDKKELAVLILEKDIINKEGYGLKRGYYNIIPDKYLDFLLIYQSGKLRAKVPVFETIVKESANPKQQKPKRMSETRYKKQLEKEKRKYFNGTNPNEIDWQEVEISYIKEKNAYLIIYNTNNIELRAIIKL